MAGPLASLARVVSGGQTGADRAALDWALRHGVEYGGWCPRGGIAEDGPGLLGVYPALQETPTEDPDVRTAWNVRDSDATLVLVLPGTRPTGGSALTVREAERLGRPHLVAATDARAEVAAWLARLPTGTVLNVAGPRESTAPGIGAAVTTLLESLGA